jgi:lipopolysaccharide export system ATP-binding protein
MTIRAENLKRAYRKRLVVRDVSLEVAQGEVVGLLGPNGAGKTTTFYMIVGLIRPHGGRVFVGEREITRLPMYQRARLGLGYLPQEASVFRQLTVEQNLLLVMEMRGIPPKARRERAEQLMDGVPYRAPAPQQGLRAVGRRATARRNRPRTRPAARLPAARRTVHGD